MVSVVKVRDLRNGCETLCKVIMNSLLVAYLPVGVCVEKFGTDEEG